MDTKLTLKLNKEVVDKAKMYASSRKKSLSRMVENYLKTIIEEEQNDEFEISPFIKSLQTGVKLPDDFDYKKDYRAYLTQKYK